MRYKRAYSLVEILIVIAVILIVAAIIVPLLSRAKQNANQTTAISNLHQLGLAANLYHQDVGEYAISVRQLVQGGYADKTLASSPFDKVPDGWANQFAKQVEHQRTAMEKPSPFRLTFMSMKGFGFGLSHLRSWEDKENPGWLVDPTIGKLQAGSAPWPWEGSYMRLCLDSAVVRRQEPWKAWTYRGRPATRISMPDLFHD